MKSLAEFRDELKALRSEMFQNAEMADSRLVASWVDRIAVSLESLVDKLESMDAELDVANECCCVEMPAPKAKPKVAKKPKKAKKAKPAKKKKRR